MLFTSKFKLHRLTGIVLSIQTILFYKKRYVNVSNLHGDVFIFKIVNLENSDKSPTNPITTALKCVQTVDTLFEDYVNYPEIKNFGKLLIANAKKLVLTTSFIFNHLKTNLPKIPENHQKNFLYSKKNRLVESKTKNISVNPKPIL